MSPYRRPRHRRPTRLPDPSDALFIVLAAFTLLAACLVGGGLTALPFAP